MKDPRIPPTRMGAPRNSVFLATIVLISLSSAALIPSSLSPFLPAAAKAELRKTAGPTRESAGKNRNAFRSLTPAAPTVPHVLPASYYSLKGNVSSTLTLNNKGPQPLDIQPTLFSMEGQRLDVPPVTVDGTSYRVIDLRLWAMPGAGFDEGSLQIVHYGMDMQLGAQVKIIDAEHSLIHDEQLMANMAMSPRLESVWWLRSHQCNVHLVLSNVTASSLTATLAVDGVNPAQASPAIIRLAAHETRLINPEQLARNGKGTLREIGGISINYNSAAGALLARGFINEVSTGFSSSIEFSDPSMAHSSKLDGGGLRLGRVGGTELTPIVVARNLGTTKSIIRGSMPYTLNDGTASLLSTPEIRLSPGEASTLDLSLAIRRSHLDLNRVVSAGLEFTYSSAPGSVLISAQSVSADGNQVFRLPLVDADAQPSSTGGYPWSIDGDSSTLVYITNCTDRPQQYVLQLNFQDGVYAPGLKTVEPNQTAVIDIRALRDGQVKDEHNQTIPLDAKHGQVQWSIEGPENLTLIGRAEQVDSVSGMSSSYACVNCCPASCMETWVDPPSVTGFVGDTQQFTGFQQNEDCFGNPLSPFSRSATWSSTNSSVATVNSTGFGTAQNVGNTSIQGTWTAFLWDLNANNTCTKTIIQPLAEAVCDVLNGPVIFTKATQDFGVANFSPGVTGDTFSATLSLPVNSPPCTGSAFPLIVRLKKRSDATLYSPTDARNFVDTPDDSQYRVNGGGLQTGTSNDREFDIRLQRITPGNPNRHIRIGVAGFTSSGGFSTTAFVTINCP
jgi:hypothetical protein